ncbi:MAG: DUF368 domain-containing protein [Bacteroidetes bacterium]|nr:DUF368 domain-containing protein [Bacteroidota bacterium]
MIAIIKKYYLLIFKGMAMGAADVVPGVSGGTIAFITGIYEELINSIKAIDLNAFKILFKKGIPAFWEKINGWFLLFLLLGIGISIVSLSKLILYLLTNYPTLLWSFFFGLVIASAIYVGSTIKKWNLQLIVGLIAGAAFAYYITIASPAQGPTELWFVFITGAIAICAMILPGISGSFIMLLMGMYEFILNSLTSLKISVILTFMAGAAIGIVSFSHLLSWMLRKYHNLTIAILTGFMIGSLNKVWPWKKVLETKIVHDKEVVMKEVNVLPNVYTELTGKPDFLVQCILLMLFGLISIYTIEYLAGRKKKLV